MTSSLLRFLKFKLARVIRTRCAAVAMCSGRQITELGHFGFGQANGGRALNGRNASDAGRTWIAFKGGVCIKKRLNVFTLTKHFMFKLNTFSSFSRH